MKASRRWNHGTLAPLRWMRQPEPFLLQGKGVPIIIFIILPYSLYAQEMPVLLSVSAWDHTHGARYQNRAGTYCLEGSRSAINLIRQNNARYFRVGLARQQKGGANEKGEQTYPMTHFDFITLFRQCQPLFSNFQ